MNQVIKIGGIEYERDSPKDIARLLKKKAKEDAKKVKKEGGDDTGRI